MRKRKAKSRIKNKEKTRDEFNRLIAESDNQIIGTVEYKTKDKRLHFMGLAVKETYRRRGVSRALINELIEIAKSKNQNVISLHTIKETGNVEIFNKLGFVSVREEIDKYSISDKFDELHDVYMELYL